MTILPKDYPLNGLVSFPFVCMLLINCMFGIRVLCIENAFFSSYGYERHFMDGRRILNTIFPIIAPDYRILVYLTPVMISFSINLFRLLITGKEFRKYVRRYPQILIACCFTPFMFEGCKVHNRYSIRIWKCGTVLNALFIGCLPQVLVFVMNIYRGITEWDFLGSALLTEGIYESNDSLIKSPYGNLYFAITSGVIFLILIILAFYTDRIFETHSIFGKCCLITCLPGPNNFFNLSNELSSSISQNNLSSVDNDGEDAELDDKSSDENKRDTDHCGTEIAVYSSCSIKWITKLPLSNELLSSKEVRVYFFFSLLNPVP